MDHLFGMYLSKLHEIETMVVDEEEEPELGNELLRNKNDNYIKDK